MAGQITTNTGTSSRVAYMRVPPPPHYPPPPSQNTPAFFPLSCVVAPHIDPEDLRFTLNELLPEEEDDGEPGGSSENPDHDQSAATVAEQQQVEADPPTAEPHMPSNLPNTLTYADTHVEHESENENEDSDTSDDSYDSDSSEEDSLGQWYTSRDYAAERMDDDRWGSLAHRLDSVLDYVLAEEDSDSGDDTFDEDEVESEVEESRLQRLSGVVVDISVR